MFERYQDPHETLLPKLDAGENREPVFGSLRLDLETREAFVENKSVELTKSEYQILWLLVRANGNIVSSEEIENFLYEDISDDQDGPLHNIIPVFLTRIRKKLDPLTEGKVKIGTFRGVGYFLEHTTNNESN